jgi:hypothetical protein
MQKQGNTAEQVLQDLSGQRFGTILIDPPWRFANRTGKMAPEHKRLHRYPTMSFDDIAALPVAELALPKSHLYLWCPNALLLEALQIMKGWGFICELPLPSARSRSQRDSSFGFHRELLPNGSLTLLSTR